MTYRLVSRVLSWSRNSLFRRSLFQRTPRYWWWRRRLFIWHARILGWSVGTQRRASETVISARVLALILKSVAWPTILATVTIIASFSIEAALRAKGIWFPSNWQIAVTLRPETYATFLGTIAQVTGVFLGLYFTAVSAVASAAYAKVPNSVRTLVVNEKVGTVYIRLVAFEAALATLLLAGQAIGLFAGYLNLATVSLGAVAAIFSFVVLGRRIFDFFDPTQLVWYIERELRVSMDSAASAKRKAMLAPLQSEYHQRAFSALASYRDFVLVATHPDNVQSEALVQLAISLCRSLRGYGLAKNQIPSTSLWFAREYRHPDWFSSDYAALSIALQTGTSLQPKELPDVRWLEKKVEEMLGSIIDALSKVDTHAALTRVAVLLSEILGGLGRTIPEDALQMFEIIAPKITAVSGRSAVTQVEEQDQRSSLNLATVYSQIPTAMLLGFSKLCEDINRGTLQAAIKRINWSKRRSIYHANLPRPVTMELENLWAQFDAEYQIEGAVFAPDWFILEHADHDIAQFLGDTTRRFLDLLDSFFISSSQRTVSAAGNVARAPVIQAGLEYCDKLAFHLSTARKRFDEITSVPSKEEIPWPAFDWNVQLARIETARETLLGLLADVASDVGKLRVEQYPDYFGQLYSFLAQECYQSLAQSADARFNRLFPRFFEIAFQGASRILQQIGSSEDAKMMLMSDPINDLLDLSGLALIYSELDNKPSVALTVRQRWDQHFSEMSEQQRLQALRSFAVWSKPPFRTTPRELVRTGWRQHLDRLLHERGLMTDMWSHSYDPEPRGGHPSPLIRAITRSPFMADSPGDIFVIEYFLRRPELVGFEVKNRKISRLRADIEQERNVSGDSEK